MRSSTHADDRLGEDGRLGPARAQVAPGIVGGLVACVLTVIVGRACGGLWAVELGTSAARLGYDAVSPLEYPLVLVTAPLGAAVGLAMSRRRYALIGRTVAAVSVGLLVLGGPAWTAHEADRAGRGATVWTWFAPAQLSARPLTVLQLRDGRDLAREGTLRVLAATSEEVVVYDVSNGRVSGFPTADTLVIRWSVP